MCYHPISAMGTAKSRGQTACKGSIQVGRDFGRAQVPKHLGTYWTHSLASKHRLDRPNNHVGSWGLERTTMKRRIGAAVCCACLWDCGCIVTKTPVAHQIHKQNGSGHCRGVSDLHGSLGWKVAVPSGECAPVEWLVFGSGFRPRRHCCLAAREDARGGEVPGNVHRRTANMALSSAGGLFSSRREFVPLAVEAFAMRIAFPVVLSCTLTSSRSSDA